MTDRDLDALIADARAWKFHLSSEVHPTPEDPYPIPKLGEGYEKSPVYTMHRLADALAAYREREQQARALLAERRRGNERRADDFGGLLRDLGAIYAKEAAS